MVAEDVEIVIVGGGISGMCMAIQLLKAGRASFVVVEKSGEVGGTWSVNQYPGCACDVPSHLYSFSFDRNPTWSRMYAGRQEIHDYLKRCAQRHAILPHFRFHTVARAAAWDEAAALWRVHLLDVSSSQASSISSKFLVRATGALHVPKFPTIKGMDRFAGPSFHSSAWDSSVDLHGKTIAIIGTGASAVQIVPQIATIAKKLYVCQRTPMWILPKLDFSISKTWKSLFEKIPFFMWIFSWLLFLIHEVLVLAFLGGKRMQKILEKIAKRNMENFIKDVKMRDLLVPKYEMGCKRLLISNTFYPALTAPNVQLITCPILEVHNHSITFGTNSLELNHNVNVDIIIYATGFDIFHPNLEIIGLSKLNLTQAGFSSMLGVTKKGFPNFFMILGPNTGVGHTSLILMVEAQVRYIISCLGLMNPLNRSMELFDSSQQRFQEFLAKRFPKTVWHFGGCNSWYVHPIDGNNYAIWPASSLEYIYHSWSANPLDYHFD